MCRDKIGSMRFYRRIGACSCFHGDRRRYLDNFVELRVVVVGSCSPLYSKGMYIHSLEGRQDV